MYDVIIRGGKIVDGTGREPFVGDVAVKNGYIAAIGDNVDGDAVQVIDATDRLVTPGFVDIHTHYDGQVTWDDQMSPSSHHGVTTLVMGNCGVGFAPVRPGQEEWLIQLMEGVEDIPGTALAEGMTWGWETFPEYLDVLAARRLTVDVGAQIAHGAVRGYVMGERGRGTSRPLPRTSRRCAPSCARRWRPARSASRPHACWGTGPWTASPSLARSLLTTSCSPWGTRA